MKAKISEDLVRDINTKMLNVIQDRKSTVSTPLKRAFYFKGRKSETIAKEIIEALTEQGNVILDPFFGGGSFILSALEAKRYIHGIELDNYTYDIFTTLLTDMNEDIIRNLFNKVEAIVKNNVMELYATTCCETKNYIKKLLFDPEDEEYYNPNPNREIREGRNVILMEQCPICKNRSKLFTQEDEKRIKESLSFDNSSFPKIKYIENSRINITASTGADRYDRVFTERNKQAFLIIQRAIDSLPTCKEKKIVQHALVSSLALGKIAMYGSSTDILYHVINNNGQDMNVWYLFESNYNSIMNFKNRFRDYQVLDVENNDLMCLKQGSYDEVLQGMDNHYDLIYTDFPYTDQVPYLERNQLFRVWLETFYNTEQFKLSNKMLNQEIVLSNSPAREEKNSIENYYRDIDKMLKVLHRVLKPNKLMVFTIKLGEAKYIRTYSEIINLARKNGFEYVTRVGIEKNDPTLRKQSAYANTFMNEIIIVFQKLDENQRYWYLNNINYEQIAIKLVYDHLLRQDEISTTLSTAINLIKNDLASKGHIINDDEIKIAAKIVSSNFLVERGIVSIDNNRLYLDIEDNKTLFIKLYDLIPLYIKKLIEKNEKFVLEDLYLELTNSLCSGNSSTLAQILDDSNHQNQITMLIKNYCDTSNGYYVEKEIDNEFSEEREDISQYTGTEFEHLIRRLLEKEGFFNITIIGGAGDRGVDIVASIMIDKNVKRYIFQCKRWIGNVGSDPIQRLFAEREYNKYDKAICITTSDYTPEGKDALMRFKVEGLNGWDVQKKLNEFFPNKYYNRALNITKE